MTVFNWKQMAQMNHWSIKELKVLIVAVGLLVILPLFISELGPWGCLFLAIFGGYLYEKNKKEKERKRGGK